MGIAVPDASKPARYLVNPVNLLCQRDQTRSILAVNNGNPSSSVKLASHSASMIAKQEENGTAFARSAAPTLGSSFGPATSAAGIVVLQPSPSSCFPSEAAVASSVSQRCTRAASGQLEERRLREATRELASFELKDEV